MAVVKANGYGHGDVEVARAAIEAGATWLRRRARRRGSSAPRRGDRGADPRALGAPARLGGRRARAPAHADAVLGRRARASRARGPGIGARAREGRHRDAPGRASGRRRTLRRSRDACRRPASRSRVCSRTSLGREEDEVDDQGTARTIPRGRRRRSDRRRASPCPPRGQLRGDDPASGVPPGPGAARHRAVRDRTGARGSARISGLRPALSWRSRVSAVKRLPAGEAVSYGHRYRLERDAWLATVPVGYADGYPRQLTNLGSVLIGGRRHRDRRDGHDGPAARGLRRTPRCGSATRSC